MSFELSNMEQEQVTNNNTISLKRERKDDAVPPVSLSPEQEMALRWRRHAENIALICWEKRILGASDGMTFEHNCFVGERHEIMRAILELNRKAPQPVFDVHVAARELQCCGGGGTYRSVFEITWTPRETLV